MIQKVAQKEFTQIFPKPGWVEHDPQEIWNTQKSMLEEVLSESAVSPAQIAAIGITNQRETAVVWDKHTGEPVYNAIVWQDTRTADICEKMKDDNLEDYVRTETGTGNRLLF